jgi:hypothetical protein
MDRHELEEKIRTRGPGDAPLRRGRPLEDDERPAHAAGYVPFVPEPEDAMAVREEEAPTPPPNVDHTAADFDERAREVPRDAPLEEPPSASSDAEAARPQTVYAHPDRPEAAYADEAFAEEPYAEGPYLDESSGAREDAYPYEPAYAGEGGGRRRGGGALPIIGFILLCVLALGVGAALAGVLGGGIGQTSTTPSPSASLGATAEPTVEPTETPPSQASVTPEPTDGPVTLPDGTIITVQPCASQRMNFDGCREDGSVITESTMWVWIGFQDAHGTDTFELTLISDGQTIDQQDKELGTLLDCPGTCSGYLIGAAYRELAPGDYQLVVRRDGDFADSATFTVEG